MNHETILFDIDTQVDFFSKEGACYEPSAGAAAQRVRRLFRWARETQVPVMSTLLRVRPGETGPLTNRPHCVEGTGGEEKLPRTVLPSAVDLGLRNTTDLPEDIFERHQQVIFETRGTDIFEHARAERLITELPPVTFVLCGAGLARPIAQAAIGLRNRGFPIIVAEDAVVDLGDPMTEMARLRMEAKGCVFAPTEEIVRPKPPRRRKRRSFRELLEMPNS
jgi:nicotinamidase-related amidase